MVEKVLEVLQAVLGAALLVFWVSALALMVVGFLHLTYQKPEIGAPIIVFVWMAAAWTIHHRLTK